MNNLHLMGGPSADMDDDNAKMERKQAIMQKELGMDPRTLQLFKAVNDNDVPFLRAAIKKGPDFELKNGADQTLIECARSRGKKPALKMLEGLRESMATMVESTLLHQLRLAHDSGQIGEMIKAAEETTLVPKDVLDHCRQQQRQREREEASATDGLAEMLSGKVYARDLQVAVDTAMESGRCEFEQLRAAKNMLAERIEIEAAAHARLKISLEHATSEELAVALCKTEEEGLIDEEGIDNGWEIQVARVDNEEMVRFLLADLVEQVVHTTPTHIRVWQVAFSQIQAAHDKRAAEAAAIKAQKEAGEQAKKDAAKKRAEDALALTAHLKEQAGGFTQAMFAAGVRDDVEVLALYVQGGADLSVKNRAGMTMWQLCKERGATKCLAYLEDMAHKDVTHEDGDLHFKTAALLHKLYFRVELFFDGRQEETREFRFNDAGAAARDGSGEQVNRAANLAVDTAGAKLVSSREVSATSLPIVATASMLLGGTPFSSVKLFDAHQHEFSLSVELLLRDQWGGERKQVLLEKVRLPRGKQVGKMSTRIAASPKRHQIEQAVDLDATAVDRRKLATGARTLQLEDLATRLKKEAEEATAAADASVAAASAGPPRIVALGPLVKTEVVVVKKEEKFDLGPVSDRLSQSRGASRQSQTSGEGRPLTGTTVSGHGSRPQSKMESRGSSRRSNRSSSAGGSDEDEDFGGPEGDETEGGLGDLSEVVEGEADDEDSIREAALKALIDAETEKTAAAKRKTDALNSGGATLAASERDLWVAMERARIPGRDTISDAPVDEKDLEALRGGWALVLGVENSDGSWARAVHSQLRMGEILNEIAKNASFNMN